MSRWGEQTELARKNFQISGEPFPLAVIHELAIIKAEAARVNATSLASRSNVRDAALTRAASALMIASS